MKIIRRLNRLFIDLVILFAYMTFTPEKDFSFIGWIIFVFIIVICSRLTDRLVTRFGWEDSVSRSVFTADEYEQTHFGSKK